MCVNNLWFLAYVKSISYQYTPFVRLKTRLYQWQKLVCNIVIRFVPLPQHAAVLQIHQTNKWTIYCTLQGQLSSPQKPLGAKDKGSRRNASGFGLPHDPRIKINLISMRFGQIVIHTDLRKRKNTRNEKLIIISAVFTNFGEGSAWIRQSHLHASSILWELYYRECENSVSPLCSKYSNFNGEREKKRRLQFRISDSSIAYSPWRCLINPAFDPRNAFIRCYHLPLSTNMNQVYWVKNIWESYACTVIESQYLQFS